MMIIIIRIFTIVCLSAQSEEKLMQNLQFTFPVNQRFKTRLRQFSTDSRLPLNFLPPTTIIIKKDFHHYTPPREDSIE